MDVHFLNYLLLSVLVLAPVLALVLLALVLLGSSVSQQPCGSTARTDRRSPTYYEDCRGSRAEHGRGR